MTIAAAQATHTPAAQGGEYAEAVPSAPPCSSAQPPLPAMGEPMTAYFKRLREAVGDSPAGCRVVSAIVGDGVYLHKRPVRLAGGSNPLAACGSVFHHCVVYVKDGAALHALDLAPANGADVTANLMEEAAAREVHDAAAAVPAEDTLPFLYLGPLAALEEKRVQAALAFARGLRYHAVGNIGAGFNCIQFADFMLRVLGGAAGGPLLYDLLCGEVPAAEHPLLLMVQLMLQRGWGDICSGAPLLARFNAAAGN